MNIDVRNDRQSRQAPEQRRTTWASIAGCHMTGEGTGDRWRPQRLRLRERTSSSTTPGQSSACEDIILQERSTDLQGRILELGCGGGRLTGHLIELGGTSTGSTCPPRWSSTAASTTRRVRSASPTLRPVGLQAQSVDVVVATNNVLDILDDDERRCTARDSPRSHAGGLLWMIAQPRLPAEPQGTGRYPRAQPVRTA